MRRFGIAKLVIHTAGTQHATVELPSLSKEDAERVRDHLVDRKPANSAAADAVPTDQVAPPSGEPAPDILRGVGDG